MNRINALYAQKKSLRDVLNQIDVEVERGIALQTFNQIDGGNTRKQTINQLTAQAQERIVSAQMLNNNIHNMNEEVLPPRTVRVVAPPRVIPVR